MSGAPVPVSLQEARGYRTRVSLLGTSGGPPWWDGSDRAWISTAIKVGDAVYLIDCGEGWGRLMESCRRCLVPGTRTGGVVPPAPTPGMTEMTRKILDGFATDINDRMRDNAKRDLREIFEVEDIQLPGLVSPNTEPSPAMAQFEVYEDDRVRVSAILVDHRPVFPAYAFRFDTDHGSIVISGDTAVCSNLVTLAQGADLLLHECIDMGWVAERIGPNSATPDQNLVQHMVAAHTHRGGGPQADRAGVETLVVTHLVPAITPVATWQQAQAGFGGKVIVGEDLIHLALG